MIYGGQPVLNNQEAQRGYTKRNPRAMRIARQSQQEDVGYNPLIVSENQNQELTQAPVNYGNEISLLNPYGVVTGTDEMTTDPQSFIKDKTIQLNTGDPVSNTKASNSQTAASNKSIPVVQTNQELNSSGSPSVQGDGLTVDNTSSANAGANNYFDATRERAAGLDAMNQIYGMGKWVQNFVQGPPPNVAFQRVALSRVRANKEPLYHQAKTIKETASGANEQLKRGLGQGSDFTAATVAVNQNTQAALEDNAMALQEVLAKENMANVEISNNESVANTELRNKEIAINYENRARAAAAKRQSLQQTEDFMLKSFRDKYNALGKVDGAQAQFNIMETAQKEQLKLEAATLKSQIEPQIEQASQKMLYDDWSQKFQGRREAIATEYEALSEEEKAATTLDDYVNQKVDAELMQYKESTDVEEYRKRAREQNSVYTYLEKILNQ